MKRFNNPFWLTLAVIAGVVLVFILVPVVKEWLGVAEKKIKRNYADNICLLTHDYVYYVSIPVNGRVNTIYLVKNEQNQFDPWEADSAVNTANRIYASATILDSNGICITSRYAVEPWQNESDEQTLKELFAKELGLNAADITTGGLSIRLSIQPAKQALSGTSPEITCIPYPVSFGDYTETRFIVRKEQNGPMPFKEIEQGVTNTTNLEKGKPLYLLGFAEQDFSLNYPLSVAVKKLRVDAYESEGTTFTGSIGWLPEGAPVFDKDLNLVGVYTQHNKKSSSFYVSALIRTSTQQLPPYLQQAITANTQKIVEDAQRMQAITDSVRAVDERLEHTVRYADEKEVSFPFLKRDGWEIMEEIDASLSEVYDNPVSDYGKSRRTGGLVFNTQEARFRIKVEGNDPAIEVTLFRLNEGTGEYEREQAFTVNNQATTVYNLGSLNGTYYLNVYYNSLSERFRLVFEKKE